MLFKEMIIVLSSLKNVSDNQISDNWKDERAVRDDIFEMCIVDS